jgi:DNA-binding response OmpR family regulator
MHRSPKRGFFVVQKTDIRESSWRSGIRSVIINDMDGKKILIVEDEAAILTLYQRFFEQEKFIVETAVDGLSGLEKARKILPDLIALDIMMPGMDGVSVLSALKGDPSTQNIPVIMLTNLGEETTLKKCLELGALAYMIKLDFTPSEIVSKVKYYLTQGTPRPIDSEIVGF